MDDKEKLHFLEEAKTLQAVKEEHKTSGNEPSCGFNVSNAASNPLKCAFLKFAASKHKFGTKDL